VSKGKKNIYMKKTRRVVEHYWKVRVVIAPFGGKSNSFLLLQLLLLLLLCEAAYLLVQDG
jgi:hypothetical protein